MNDLIKFMKSPGKSGQYEKGGRVAIYDATNSTTKRRKWIVSQLTPHLESPAHIIFIETLCTDPKIVENNIRRTKLSMPDYAEMTATQAVEDFKKRIAHYESACESLGCELSAGLSLSHIPACTSHR